MTSFMSSPTRRNRCSVGGFVATLCCLALGLFLPVAGLAQGVGPMAEEENDHIRPRPRFDKHLESALGHGRDLRTVIVKLSDDSGVKVDDGRLIQDRARHSADKRLATSATEALQAINEVLEVAPDSRLEPLFQLPTPLLDAMRNTGERNTGEALTDLSQFFVLHLANKASGQAVIEELLVLPGIETLYGQRGTRLPVDKPPVTPDFENTVGPGQGYRDPAPLGIDIATAWQRGFNGGGVTVADIEAGWHLAHEDLDHLLTQVPPVPMIPANQWMTTQAGIDHGTATLGVLASGNNGYGTTGLIPGSTIRVAPLNLINNNSWIGPNAVVLATINLQAGDVILLEAEIPISPIAAVPFETDPAEYAAVKQATSLGIHVIEPAGNSSPSPSRPAGGLNLDSHLSVMDAASGKSKFDRYFRDSGAVLVGGGLSAVTRPNPWSYGYHSRYPNSNYGTKVDTYAWGQNITTLGYGPRSGSLANCANPADPFPLFPADPDQQYTNCYNGTSGAGAIVAGAAAILEQKHRVGFGQPFHNRDLRNHLALGTPSLGAVGHQPALEYQMDFIDRGGLVPHLLEAEVSPNQSFQRFGQAVAGTGDVNGDGTPDVIVGIPDFNVTLSNNTVLASAGRVYVFSGATDEVLYQFDGAAADDRLGASVDGGGDANGDGVPDFVIGIPGYDTASLTDAGRATVYTSSPMGVFPYSFDGVTAGEAFGSAVAFVGNVNPPGSNNPEPFDDFIVGAPGLNGNGRAVVLNFLGWNLGSFTGTQAASEFGFAVAGAGDLNNDNIPDLLVGAPGFDISNRTDVGKVYAYSGANGALIFSRAGDKDVLPVATARYGASVDGIGDFSGNGSLEIVVGAPTSSTIPGGTFGRADILTANGNFLATFSGGHPRDLLGTAVAGVGDFNGDGYDDVAIGSPSVLSGPLVGRPGRVHVKLGGIPTSDPPFYQERLFWTLERGTLWGASLGAVGDINGDGLADLIAGEPTGDDDGRAYVFSYGPGPRPGANQARLIADLPAIEAHDTDVPRDGFGGGGSSPSSTTFTLDAGVSWAGADYLVLGMPDVGAYLTGNVGQLDGAGRTSTPVFGPIQSSILCAAVGYRQPFLGAALVDIDGDGQYDIFSLSNTVEVEVINEPLPPCR